MAKAGQIFTDPRACRDRVNGTAASGCYPVTTYAKRPFSALRANKKRATYRPNFTQKEEHRGRQISLRNRQRPIRYAWNTLEMDKKGVAL